MHVSQSFNDLAEHAARICLLQRRSSLSFQNVEQGTSGTIECYEVCGGGGVVALKEREDVLVGQRGPDSCFMCKPGLLLSPFSKRETVEGGMADDFDSYDIA